MTKLGAQPGVHGSEDNEKEAIKIDPKVFTVLQPTIIPMPAPPQKPAPSPAFQAMRACFHCMFFATCLLLVTLLGFYFLAATPDIFKKTETTTSSVDKPQMEALINAQPIEVSSEKSSTNSAENGGIMAIPLARVVVVEDISNNEGQKKTVVDGSVEEKSTSNLDRPLHPDEIEQYRMMEARQQFQQMMEERMYMQQMMAMRMMRMRRLQAAYYQQQQMKMAFIQQQQQQMQEEAARQQWAERARYEEEQRRQWEAQQAYAQQQRAQAFWQQHQMEMQAQQAQAQQAQAQWQQQEQQQQQQPPQHFWPRPMMHQQRPSVWQQPPQQFFFPSQQQQQNQQPQQPQQAEDRFPQAPQFFQPIPQPSVHDKIYEELQKKSQNIPVNAPSRQIWTAITPTPAPEEQSGNADVTVAPTVINTAIPAVVASSTPMPEDAAEVSDTILRDIFSAFDEQKNSEAANKELNSVPSTTQEPELEGKGAIVIEDSFPRIEERTTTPEPMESDEEIEHSSSSEDKDHEKELDPFAAVLKFFENNPPREVIEATTEKPQRPLII
ncbi:CBN-BRP-1 protein [Caenorhabditis brenneri]|uniref:CBN-BRP-1 protein n=1 Tax=Caenorhabditis brenneri TaxID=135651 RepID=G0NRJ7_CAEBE|nr:CBN-BRP-1 protein [Caenorhabditis brenneri]